MKQIHRIRHLLFIVVGVISLALGIIGILLPVLPTTPFLLLAAYCFLRSSKKLYHWLTHHKVLGSYVTNYLEHKAVKKQAKIMALIMIWTSIPFSIIFFIESMFVRIVLILIAMMVSIHILRLRTYTDALSTQASEQNKQTI